MTWSETKAPYAQLFKAMLDEQVRLFGAHHDWQASAEDGSLIRQQTHPLLAEATRRWGVGITTRTLSRIIEMVRVCDNPRITISEKAGTAHASRGVLEHKIALDEVGNVESYIIDAPTDRYFAKGGLVEKSLLGQKIPHGDIKWVRQLIWAIDPCVEFVVHADNTNIKKKEES